MAVQKSNESGERFSRRRERIAAHRPSGRGLAIEQVFSNGQIHPFDDIEWESRTAHIGDDKGKVIFQQTDVEVPSAWSQLATNVVVSKYFYGDPSSAAREKSVRTLVHRVTRTIADWGKADGMFATAEDAERFYQDLTYLCVNQYGSFNSPVWFNVGLFHQGGVKGSEGNYHWDAKTAQPAKTMHGYEYPQASACFIQSVADTMEDIMRLCHAEAMLFKYGSGTGTDLSTLRSSREKLSGGGTPSGPLSFMRVFDQIAAVVKSGGKTRRAAKMQSLRCDHPDIKEFIECKMNEERKAWALIEQGYDGSFNGEAYSSVMYQNANLSIRATDEFMQAAIEDLDWQTREVTGERKPSIKYKAKDLLGAIAEGTHVCGDPGVQFHTTINRWHTCKTDGEICASNPCSEYMFLNDSACNLASLNLMKFRREDGSMDIERFRAAARLFIIAQDILVDHASYPSDRICANSHAYRPLGLGYANLGALLMSLGMPYDGDAGRATAAAITAIMTATAYAASSEIAANVGTFDRFEANRRPMLDVMAMHRGAVDKISPQHCREELIAAARAAWDQALEAGSRAGYRNAQVTVLAPTGTIGFMMDCDTTGIEPDIALVKYKQLAGGGMFKLVNQTVPLALKQLGYSPAQVAEIIEYIDEHDTIEDAPHIQESHLSVFDCAFKPANGRRCIHYMGHIRMMGAVQPFISGAISKTVNIPNEASVEQIQQVYTEAWKLGIKAVAIYRDGSKRTQPLNVRKEGDKKVVAEKTESLMTAEALAAALDAARRQPHRNRLPATRPSMTHKFDVAGHEGYLNVGLYANGEPGELFITMAKEGSTVGGMMDAFATAISLCLQYGVPLDALVKKFTHQRFEPSGMTSNRDIPFAKSIVDYIFRWLGLTFLEEYRKANMPDRGANNTSPAIPRLVIDAAPEAVKDDKPSEPGRADRTSDTDDQRSGGALLDGSYVGSVSTPRSPSKGREKAVAAAAVEKQPRVNRLDQLDKQFSGFQEDAPACDVCGAITVRNGNCYKCYNCGSSLGCS
ncbi:MAG: vitamin B12-dependent ribonucleotide reductase [Planctomycetaceae bacterium]|nr:vitamin B12-dependent ribonucleotide reductase [Planctomycetaceae bacterium]